MNINAVTNNPYGLNLYPAVSESQAAQSQPVGYVKNPSKSKNHNSVQPGPDTNTETESNTSSSNNISNTEKNISADPQTAGLTDAELRILEELKKADAAVRSHEMAHVAAGGRYVTSGASFTYKKGPDGKNYAVGGEVSIDTSPVPGDPRATLQKMQQVRNAALAPANPSAQDIKVASKATSTATKAMSELMVLQAKEQASKNSDQVFGMHKNAADSYIKVKNMPEQVTSNFSIAV